MRILITAPYHDEGRRKLEETFGQVIYKLWKSHGRAYSEDELIGLLTEVNADALITEHDEVTAKVIKAYPQLRFIGVCRGTPSNVDLEAAALHGIPVLHTPARNAQAVAEMFVANVINLMRNTIAGWQWLQAKQWGEGAHTSYLQFKGYEMAGKTIGMVGMGAVANRIAEMVKCFPCHIQYYDPFVQHLNPDYDAVSIEKLFETSDIISIQLPANQETENIINGDLIQRMKPGSIFVNTSRASVVDTHALLQAVEACKIRGAVIDVYDHEPPNDTDYRLINHSNVLATPHIAGATFEVEDHHVTILNAKLLDWAGTHLPATVPNI